MPFEPQRSQLLQALLPQLLQQRINAPKERQQRELALLSRLAEIGDKKGFETVAGATSLPANEVAILRATAEARGRQIKEQQSLPGREADITSAGQQLGALLSTPETDPRTLSTDLESLLETLGPEGFRRATSRGVSEMRQRQAEESADFRSDLLTSRLKAAEPPTLSELNAISDDFNSLSREFIDVRNAFGRVIAAAENPSAAGDLALIFNFMKMLDPGSVVREGEFATAETAAGVPARIINQYNKLLEGIRLGKPDDLGSTRQDFVDRARRLFTRQRASHLQLERQFQVRARRLGVDPGVVVFDFVGPFRHGLSGKITQKDINRVGRELGTDDVDTIVQELLSRGFVEESTGAP